MTPVTLALAVALAAPVPAAKGGKFDWPQFRGPDRDGVSKETGLLKEWPAGGPKKAWTVSGCGGGYSTVAVAERMNVQYETAKTYLRRVREKYAKVGRPASKKAELIRRAAEDGYLE